MLATIVRAGCVRPGIRSPIETTVRKMASALREVIVLACVEASFGDKDSGEAMCGRKGAVHLPSSVTGQVTFPY